MIDPEKLRRHAAGKYPLVVEARLRGENIFPLPVQFSPIKTTGTRDEIKRDINALLGETREKCGFGLTVEFASVDTEKHGRNDIPQKAFFADETDFLRYTGKQNEFQKILRAREILASAFPAFAEKLSLHWKMFRAGDDAFWKNICRVLEYFRATPFPEKYIRELPVEVPTKFIEENFSLLLKLIAVVAPESIDDTGNTDAEKLGLKTPEALIECRLLDDAIRPEWKFRQLTVTLRDLEHFEQTAIDTILITENRTNFLTLPALPRTLAIQGQGNAVARLKNARFLDCRRIFYWGDIDVQGFEILAGLRRNLPHAQSIMMDRATYEKLSVYRVAGTATRNAPEKFLPHLNDSEKSLFLELAQRNLRLEQERIPQAHAFGEFNKQIVP